MFLDFYRENEGSSELAQKANEKLLKFPLADRLVGKDKLLDLDDIDMESKLSQQFMPSLFYTFMYSAENDSVAGVKFSDAIPLVLCCKVSQTHMEGFNFNLLPPIARAVILEVVDRAYDGYYSEKAIVEVQNGGVAFNENFGSILLNEKSRLEFIRMIESKMGISVSKAFRKYNLKHISDSRLIEYSDYKLIPFLQSTESVRGANLLKLQSAVIQPDK